MARGRMISKSLSTSEKFAELIPRAGPLAEFCQLLFPLMVSHTDDFGRLQGDPFTVKLVCHPSSPRPVDDFARGLELLQTVELIDWYTVNGKKYIQIQQFEPHQQGLHKRTKSRFPEIPGNSGSIEEKRRELNTSYIQAPVQVLPSTACGRQKTDDDDEPLTRQETTLAERILKSRFGRCEHNPPCPNSLACTNKVAYEIRAKRNGG